MKGHALSWNSLTLRLGVLYALVSAILLTVVGVMVCHTLEAELLTRDHAELVAKASQLKEALGDFESVAALRARQADFFGAIYDNQRQAILVADINGNTLLASRALMVPNDLLMAFARDRQQHPREVSWAKGRDDWAAVLAWGELGQRSIASVETTPVVVAVALNRSSTNLMLDQFYRWLWSLLVAGGLAAAAVGVIIAWQGLQPLRTIDRTASAITADRLSDRLDLKRAPDEVRRLGASFNAMLGRLHLSFERLSAFSSDLAHELRTPINNLLGHTHVALSRERTTAEYREVLESNAEELERLRRMTEDMLFLAKADNPETSLTWDTFEVRDELDKVAEYFDVVASDNRVTIAIDGRALLRADRRLVQRALNNLFANAVRHAPLDSIVHARITEAAHEIRISVSNTGGGIAGQHLLRLFDRFYRIDPSRPRGDVHSAEANGLGLAIVQSIMRMHGGLATAASTPGAMTTFSLHFPKSRSAQ